MTTALTTQSEDHWLTRFLPERYTFQVGPSTFSLSFVPVLFFEEYNEEQLQALVQSSVWEVSFADETVMPDGRLVTHYGLTGKGGSFKVLGSVAHAILSWAREKRPNYLCWWSLEPKRRSMYAHMLSYFAARGSEWQRRTTDPFTGKVCRPEVFWVGR